MHLIYPNEVAVKDTTDTQKSASYLDVQLEIENWGRRFKANIYDKRDNFIFQQSTSRSTVAIFQHHMRVEFTLLYSYAILGRVHSTVIFGQSSQADADVTQTRLRCIQVEVITRTIIRSCSRSSWPLRNMYISNENGSFDILRRLFFFPLILKRPLPHLRRLPFKRQELLTLLEHLSALSDFWWGPCCSYL